MKTIENLEKEYSKYRINAEEIEGSFDIFECIEEEIVELTGDLKTIDIEMTLNGCKIKKAQFKNKFTKIFKEKDYSLYEKDNKLLLDIEKLILNNLEYLVMIKDNMTEENYLELGKLAAFANNHYHRNMDIILAKRDILVAESKGEKLNIPLKDMTDKDVDKFVRSKIALYKEKPKQLLK